MQPGVVVECRKRLWVLLPAATEQEWVLRPLTSGSDEAVVLHKRLSQLACYTLPDERLQSASFPLPQAEHVADAASAHLLWQSVRLTLREGAAPLRSLGRISIRPRTYQFVPLLMALRLKPVRLFIADDVGVGKTIEALLVARELWDRGEIERLCVLCPPYLCEQWAKEMAEIFNFEPVVIRSGTVGQLERQTPNSRSFYEQFPVQVASIDFVKTERNRAHFLQFCPELVIIDEVHAAAAAAGASQQQRHALLKEVARDPRRHLILLTATPHSGIEDAFRSLLGLLHPAFTQWDLSHLTEKQRVQLARHFVQRTRGDIKKDWQGQDCFPERVTVDATYQRDPSYHALFDQTYEFCCELVRSGGEMQPYWQRVRYWGALALLRCVMSSPAAAVATLDNRRGAPLEADGESEFHAFVFESTHHRTDDTTPTPPLEAATQTLDDAERRRLRHLAKLAQDLHGPERDSKLRQAIRIVQQLLDEGFCPILWCRYVRTAEYLGEHLRQSLPEHVQVLVLTGQVGDDERLKRLQELDAARPRVLVATDCLSEGINLHELFTAVVHYDLPWNPNRLEQREGRVDRYGQAAPTVKAVRFYGQDNPIDGTVIRVLLDKARAIYRTLGTHVPVPEENESVLQAVMEALFLRHRRGGGRQLALDFEIPEVSQLHRRWERDAERERINRSLFAQPGIKPQEVQRELEAVDAVLGDPAAVREFVLAASQRLGMEVRADRRSGVYRVSVSAAATANWPEPVRLALFSDSSQTSRIARTSKTDHWLISFDSPTPPGAEYVGRNHPFVAALARYLFELALNRPDNTIVSRCGAVRTRAVTVVTDIFLLRVRYLIHPPPEESSPEGPSPRPLLAEEALLLGFEPHARGGRWLPHEQTLLLLTQAQPDANIPLGEKRELVQQALDLWPRLEGDVRSHLHRRAAELADSHNRLRQAVSMPARALEVQPQLPPDVIGVLVLQPMVQP